MPSLILPDDRGYRSAQLKVEVFIVLENFRKFRLDPNLM